MDTHTTLTDQDLARDRIELAWRTYHFCSGCGRDMTIEAHDAGLWIECMSLRDLRGLRLFLASSFHDRHAIDVPADLATAVAA